MASNAVAAHQSREKRAALADRTPRLRCPHFARLANTARAPQQNHRSHTYAHSPPHTPPPAPLATRPPPPHTHARPQALQPPAPDLCGVAQLGHHRLPLLLPARINQADAHVLSHLAHGDQLAGDGRHSILHAKEAGTGWWAGGRLRGGRLDGTREESGGTG
eukprot:91860-Chlamydomonas_euryale.AAC.1